MQLKLKSDETNQTLSKIELLSSPNSPTANFNFFLIVVLKSQSGEIWKNNSTVILTVNSETKGSLISTTGKVIFTIYARKYGQFVIDVSSGTIKASITLNIQSEVLKLIEIPSSLNLKQNLALDNSLNFKKNSNEGENEEENEKNNKYQQNSQDNPKTITTFTCVGVYDQHGNNLEVKHGPYTIVLKVKDAKNAYITYTNTTIKGIAFFNNIVILESSKNTMVISCSSINSTLSVSGSKIEKVSASYLEIISNISAPTAFFNFKLTVSIKDQFGRFFTVKDPIKLSATSNIDGSISLVPKSGKAEFLIYSKSPGPIVITANYFSIVSSLYLSILNQKLKYTKVSSIVINIQPKTTSNVFSITVGVFDNSGLLLESSHSNYVITLSLNPLTSLAGNTKVTTKNGICVLDLLQIKTPGTYKFIASSPDIIDAISVRSYTIESPKITYIELLTIKSITEYFEFDVYVTIKDQGNVIWQNDCDARIQGNLTLYGTLNKIIHGGKDKFTIYVKETGIVSIIANASSGNSNTSLINILPLKTIMEITEFIVIYI